MANQGGGGGESVRGRRIRERRRRIREGTANQGAAVGEQARVLNLVRGEERGTLISFLSFFFLSNKCYVNFFLRKLILSLLITTILSIIIHPNRLHLHPLLHLYLSRPLLLLVGSRLLLLLLLLLLPILLH